MSTFSATPIPVLEIWSKSFKLFRESYQSVWQQTLTLALVLSLPLLLSILPIFPNALELYHVAIQFTLSAIIGIVSVYFIGVLMHSIHTFGTGKVVNLRDSLEIAKEKLVSLVFGGGVVILASLLGLMLLLLPGIFLAVILSMTLPLILFGNLGTIEALKNSCKLVWGNWWRASTIVIPLLFVLYGLSYLVSKLVLGGKWYILIANFIFTAVFYPLLYSALLTLFNDLKLRKKPA